MDLEKMARELGAALQKDERYIKLQEAIEGNEKDTELNELMKKIHLIQVSYQHEASKEDANEQKLEAYNEEFNEVYELIMSNSNMKAYEAARNDFDKLMKYITGIISCCAYGEDPETCDPDAHSECGGNCSSCHSDCH